MASTKRDRRSSPEVVIVGGGLAGLAAAEAIARASHSRFGVSRPDAPVCRVTILEAKRVVGGRAGSFVDATTGETVDYCQHVAMGCCSEFLGLMKRCNLLDAWARYDHLIFHHPGYPPSKFAGSSWLPPPLHLMGALNSLVFLTKSQKREVARGMFRLMRTSEKDLQNRTAHSWLTDNGQRAETIAKFWDVFLVSALGEATRKVAMAAARKVLVDGFARTRGASDVYVPRLPLSELIGTRLKETVETLGAKVNCGCSVHRVEEVTGNRWRLHWQNQQTLDADQVIVAVPWHRLRSVFGEGGCPIDHADLLDRFTSSPITGIHLWFDRQIMDQDHAVMVGTASQWLFRQPHTGRPSAGRPSGGGPHTGQAASQVKEQAEGFYYQVVISASHRERKLEKDALIQQVLAEIRSEFPAAIPAKLLHARMVTDPQSVFSITPEVESIRRLIRPAPPSVHLAGDWTPTGWPATMESAVISGRKAAQAVMKDFDMAVSIREVPPDPAGWLVKLLIKES